MWIVWVNIGWILLMIALLWSRPSRKFKLMFGVSPREDFGRVETAVVLTLGLTLDSIDRMTRRKAEAEREGDEKAVEYFSEGLRDLIKERSRQEALARKFGYTEAIKKVAQGDGRL